MYIPAAPPSDPVKLKTMTTSSGSRRLSSPTCLCFRKATVGRWDILINLFPNVQGFLIGESPDHAACCPYRRGSLLRRTGHLAQLCGQCAVTDDRGQFGRVGFQEALDIVDARRFEPLSCRRRYEPERSELFGSELRRWPAVFPVSAQHWASGYDVVELYPTLADSLRASGAGVDMSDELRAARNTGKSSSKARSSAWTKIPRLDFRLLSGTNGPVIAKNLRWRNYLSNMMPPTMEACPVRLRSAPWSSTAQCRHSLGRSLRRRPRPRSSVRPPLWWIAWRCAADRDR